MGKVLEEKIFYNKVEEKYFKHYSKQKEYLN
jgi:hypothetical protein